MSTANRKDIARKISQETGYYMQDIEVILEAEAKAVSDLLEEGYTKVKNHKFMQIEIDNRPPKRAWDGLKKQYFDLPSRKLLKFKPLKDLESTIKRLNEGE